MSKKKKHKKSEGKKQLTTEYILLATAIIQLITAVLALLQYLS